MAKTNISFNDKNYQIDDASLSTASAALKSHLSTVMNGAGATINLDGVAYGVDSTKLATATNAFVSHLDTVAGNGYKVMVGGVEYGVDSAKMSGAVGEIEAVLGGLNNPDAPSTGDEILEGDGQEFYKFAPAALTFRSTAPLNELQEVQINGVTVDPSNYTLEEGSTIVTLSIEYLKTLDVDDYEITVVSDSKSAKGGFSVVQPELNEYGFYYNQPYVADVAALGGTSVFFFREDGTMDFMIIEQGYTEVATYTSGINSVCVTAQGGIFNGTVSEDGTRVYCSELATTFALGDVSIASDEDYIYVYREDLGGYEVSAIDKTKAEYGAIKTGINGIPTVKLKDYIFYDNSNLVVAPSIPNSVTTIGEGAFRQCINLENVAISNSVISIGAVAFSGCSRLMNITIPSSVITINDEALAFCTSLAYITFEGTVEQWNAITFVDDGNAATKWNKNVPATYVQCSDGQVAL